jgi:hypothetical protein
LSLVGHDGAARGLGSRDTDDDTEVDSDVDVDDDSDVDIDAEEDIVSEEDTVSEVDNEAEVDSDADPERDIDSGSDADSDVEAKEVDNDWSELEDVVELVVNDDVDESCTELAEDVEESAVSGYTMKYTLSKAIVAGPLHCDCK